MRRGGSREDCEGLYRAKSIELMNSDLFDAKSLDALFSASSRRNQIDLHLTEFQ